MERESKFNSIAKVEIFSSITALILGVFVSYIGGGVYSLVTQTLAYSSLSAIGLFFYTRWIPSAYFSFAEVRGFLNSLQILCYLILLIIFQEIVIK